MGCNGYVDKDKHILLFPKKGTNTKSSYSVEFALDNLSNTYVGTNPYISNQIVYEMIENSKIPYFNDKTFTHMKREKTVLNSRFDIYLEDDQDNKYFVEVKTATRIMNVIRQFSRKDIVKRKVIHLVQEQSSTLKS